MVRGYPDAGEAFDLVVLGSGVAGLTAALTASLAGLRVVVLEHADSIGGTSARSSGTVWVPDNHLMRAGGMTGDAAAAEAYLAALSGDGPLRPMARVFLDKAPRMLLDLEQTAGIAFRPFMAAPDYRQDLPGAGRGGRPLEPLPFDGRLLGDDFARLAWPIRELMVFGGMMITRSEAALLLKADRSIKAMVLGARLVARYVMDRLRHRRGTRLVLGNALVARLLKACLDRGVTVLTGVEAQALIRADGRVAGAEVRVGQGVTTFRAGRGVVLAGGGYPSSPEWRAAQLPQPTPEYTPAAAGCDGSTIRLGLDAGGVLGPSGFDNALWFPSSVAKRLDGSTAVYPHIVLDRAKPGSIIVNANGERFANEAASYHQFVRAMYTAHAVSPTIPAWMICNRDFIRRYGLGLIRPRMPSIRRHVDSGYLREGRTLAELAARIDVPADRLEATVRRFDAFADAGRDGDFGRGDNLYDRSNGDPSVAPNPCLGRVGKGPFYAVALHPTPLGTSRGLLADVNAQVLDAEGQPILGLHVCGNDMQSAFDGEYPGAGAQLGQAMTFGWIAARHAAMAPAEDNDFHFKEEFVK